VRGFCGTYPQRQSRRSSLDAGALPRDAALLSLHPPNDSVATPGMALVVE
jgi:hypothetical protein